MPCSTTAIKRLVELSHSSMELGYVRHTDYALPSESTKYIHDISPGLERARATGVSTALVVASVLSIDCE